MTHDGFRGDGHGRRGYPNARLEVDSDKSEALREMIQRHVEEAKERLRAWGVPIPFNS